MVFKLKFPSAWKRKRTKSWNLFERNKKVEERKSFFLGFENKNKQINKRIKMDTENEYFELEPYEQYKQDEVSSSFFRFRINFK